MFHLLFPVFEEKTSATPAKDNIYIGRFNLIAMNLQKQLSGINVSKNEPQMKST